MNSDEHNEGVNQDESCGLTTGKIYKSYKRSQGLQVEIHLKKTKQNYSFLTTGFFDSSLEDDATNSLGVNSEVVNMVEEPLVGDPGSVSEVVMCNKGQKTTGLCGLTPSQVYGNDTTDLNRLDIECVRDLNQTKDECVMKPTPLVGLSYAIIVYLSLTWQLL